MIFTSEAKRVLYRKGADIPVDGQLNEGTWILIQICFVDQHGVGPLVKFLVFSQELTGRLVGLFDEYK